MSKARLVVTAVVVGGRSQGEAARAYGVSQATAPGNPTENRLLEQTVAELDRLGLRPR
jgi:hypothetical protein